MAQLIIPQGTLFTGLGSVCKRFDSNDTSQQFDLVNIQSAKIKVAGASQIIAGFLNQETAITNASTNCEINITPFMTIVMANNNSGAPFAATDVGNAFDITGGTGAQVIATSTRVTSMTIGAPTVAMRCIKYNPQGIRDDLNTNLTIGLFVIMEAQFAPI